MVKVYFATWQGKISAYGWANTMAMMAMAWAIFGKKTYWVGGLDEVGTDIGGRSNGGAICTRCIAVTFAMLWP